MRLSTGEKQRLALARSLLMEPRALLLDEPTSGLDPNQIREIRDLIAELTSADAEARQTVILSSHILAEVRTICGRVVMINEGRKTVDASIEELTRDGQSLEALFARQSASDLGDVAVSREVS